MNDKNIKPDTHEMMLLLCQRGAMRAPDTFEHTH